MQLWPLLMVPLQRHFYFTRDLRSTLSPNDGVGSSCLASNRSLRDFVKQMRLLSMGPLRSHQSHSFNWSASASFIRAILMVHPRASCSVVCRCCYPTRRSFYTHRYSHGYVSMLLRFKLNTTGLTRCAGRKLWWISRMLWSMDYTLAFRSSQCLAASSTLCSVYGVLSVDMASPPYTSSRAPSTKESESLGLWCFYRQSESYKAMML